MSEDAMKLIVNRLCKHTSQLAQLIADVRSDIAVLTQFIIEISADSDAEKSAFYEKLNAMRQRAGNRLSEFPPPDPDDIEGLT